MILKKKTNLRKKEMENFIKLPIQSITRKLNISKNQKSNFSNILNTAGVDKNIDKKSPFNRNSTSFSTKSNILTKCSEENLKNLIEIRNQKKIFIDKTFQNKSQQLKIQIPFMDLKQHKSLVGENRKIVDLYNTRNELSESGHRHKKNVYNSIQKNQNLISSNEIHKQNNFNKNSQFLNILSENKIINSQSSKKNNDKVNIEDNIPEVLNNIIINDDLDHNFKKDTLQKDSDKNNSFNKKVDYSDKFDNNFNHQLNKNDFLSNILNNININNESKSRNLKKNTEIYTQSKNCSSNKKIKDSSIITQLNTQINNRNFFYINSTNNNSRRQSVLTEYNKPVTRVFDHLNKDYFVKNKINSKEKTLTKNSKLNKPTINRNKNTANIDLKNFVNKKFINKTKDKSRNIAPANHTYINMNLNLNINLDMHSNNLLKTEEVFNKNSIGNSCNLIDSSAINNKRIDSKILNRQQFNNKNSRMIINEKSFYLKEMKFKNNRSFYESYTKTKQNQRIQSENFKEKVIKRIDDKLITDSIRVPNEIRKSSKKKIDNGKQIIYPNESQRNISVKKINYNKNCILDVKNLIDKNTDEKRDIEVNSYDTWNLRTNFSNNESAKITVNSKLIDNSQITGIYKDKNNNTEISKSYLDKTIFNKCKIIYILIFSLNLFVYIYKYI